MQDDAQGTKKVNGSSVPSPRKVTVSVAHSYAKDTAHDRLRFGHPLGREPRGRHASTAFIAPDQAFAYVRWRGGEHGTTDWQVFVCRAPVERPEGASST